MGSVRGITVLRICHVCCQKQRVSYLIMKDVSEVNTSSQSESDEAGQPVIFSWLSWLSKVVLLVKKPGGETGTLASHTRD